MSESKKREEARLNGTEGGAPGSNEGSPPGTPGPARRLWQRLQQRRRSRSRSRSSSEERGAMQETDLEAGQGGTMMAGGVAGAGDFFAPVYP